MNESKKNPQLELWEKVRALDKVVDPLVLGSNYAEKLLNDPRHLLFTFARYKHAAKLLPHKKGKTVLEFGCGEGLGSFFLSENASKVVGVDFDDAAITHAKAHVPKECVEFICGDFMEERFGKFDGVVSLDVVEHIEVGEVDRYFKACVDNLADGGVCIIGTPNETAAKYASEASKIGHINNYSAERLYDSLSAYFKNVFILGMNDEVLHTGFYPMCHYLLAVACNPL